MNPLSSKSAPEPLVFHVEIDPRLLKSVEAVYLGHLQTRANQNSFLPSFVTALAEVAKQFGTKCGAFSMEDDLRGAPASQDEQGEEEDLPIDVWIALFQNTLEGADHIAHPALRQVFLQAQDVHEEQFGPLLVNGVEVETGYARIYDKTENSNLVYIVLGTEQTQAIVSRKNPIVPGKDPGTWTFGVQA